jgi:hypothetical protein
MREAIAGDPSAAVVGAVLMFRGLHCHYMA